MSIKQGGKTIAGATQYHPDLFDWKWADHQLDDVQWLRADTFSWQSGAVYQAAYQHLADDLGIAQQFYAWTSTYVPIVYGTLSETPSVGDKVYIIYNGTVTDFGSTVSGVVSSSIITIGSYNFERTPAEDTIATVMPAPQTETIAGTTITYYTAPDGHKIVLADQESNVAAIYAATGVAWYYILDTANQRFKLPRTKFGVTGLRDTVGNYVAAGLPNLSLYTPNSNDKYGSQLNAIYNVSSTSGANNNIIATNQSYKLYIKDDNNIVGNSTTVQPPATQMYLYFYVGTFTQTALENTAGLNAELFNGKADVTALLSKLNTSADNLTATGLTNLFGYLAPDFTAGVSKAANTTHTADTDGWIWVYQFSSGDRYFYIDGVQVHLGAGNGSPQYSGNGALVPIAKGHTYLGNDRITFYPVIGV